MHIPVALRWGDQDAYGHVNNVEVLRLVEEARVRSFWSSDVPGSLNLDPGSSIWSLVSRIETEYLAPMPYTVAPIDIEVWLGSMKGARLDVCFELFSPAGVEPRVLYARSSTTIVTVDAESNRPVRIPAPLLEAWAAYVEAPLAFSRR